MYDSSFGKAKILTFRCCDFVANNSNCFLLFPVNFFFPVPRKRKKKIIAIPFSGAQECCLISFWVYVYFEKWGSVQNAMGEMTIHFSFILRAFFSIQQISLFLSRTLYYLKSPVHHCASQVDSPISDTTSGYFLSSTSLSSLLQKLSGSYLLVLNS